MRLWIPPVFGTTILALILLALLPASAEARRVALVIGNGDYQHVEPLPNPANDARAMAVALEGVGFEVVEGIDLDRRSTVETLSRFAGLLEGADVGLFFYAGHGIQVNGINYLVPVDAALSREADVFLALVSLDQVLQVMETEVPTRLAFLDACRDNPLARSLSRSMGKTRSAAVGQGLARVDTAAGTLIAYSTAPGEVAEDGSGRNSPFTAALLDHIATPGIEARQVLSRVRQEVHQQTGGRQVPWDSSSLMGDFYFSLEISAGQGPSAELLFWDSIKHSADPADFQVYLERFGKDGLFHELAVHRISTLGSGTTGTAATPVVAGVAPPPPRSAAEPGSIVRDCADCPEFVVVPPGSFRMGSASGDPGHESDEGPPLQVGIARPFAIGRRELSRGEYRRFVEATGHASQAGCWVWKVFKTFDRGKDWRADISGSSDALPVTCVSVEDAEAYAAWLSRETGARYRLPSEAEYYWAASGGAHTPYPWGHRLDDACDHANVYDRSGRAAMPLSPWKSLDCDDGFGHLAPVGSFRPNAFGLHDMIGNASAYVGDCYAASLDGHPVDGGYRRRGADCNRVPLKGGSNWAAADLATPLSDRWVADRKEGGFEWIGFRLVRELD